MVTSSVADSTLDADVSGRPDMRATIVRSIITTFFVMLIGVSIPLALFMESWVGGISVALFTAMFGGPGFGLMAGMALYNLHMEKWEAKHPELAGHH
ncbi:MAG: hypothetical protein KDB26_03185 [Microthrixaceae bacterium]|nr:hypothetical protein [Microthrixaceae bacterium]